MRIEKNFSCFASKKSEVQDKCHKTRTSTLIKNFSNSQTHNVWGSYYGVIYKITDTNKDGYWDYKMVYIGQTIQTLVKRFYADLNYPHNKYLEHAINRYNKKFTIISIDSEHAQTKGGELKIEVIKKCYNLYQLNQEEIKTIMLNKSHIPTYHKYIGGKIIPLYGYNMSKGGGARLSLTGKLHPLYIHIDKSTLENLVIEGFLNNEIASEFDISRDRINEKVRNLYQDKGLNSLYDLRVHLNAIKQYRVRKTSITNESFHMQRIIDHYNTIDHVLLKELLESESSSLEIDEIFLNKLIFLGLSKNQISNKINLGERACIERIQEIFNINNFIEFRDLYFFKPRIVIILKEGFLAFNKITEKFNTGYKSSPPIYKLSTAGIKSPIQRIWNKEYNFYLKQFSEYEKKYSNEFLKFLNRMYYIYPRINAKFVDVLINSEKNPDEIDCDMLKLLIYDGYNIKQISNILKMPYIWTRDWFSRIIRMDYNTARDKFYWRARIYKIIKEKSSIPSQRELSYELNILENNLYKILNRVFNNELKKLGNIKSVFENIKEFFFPNYKENLLNALKNKYIPFLSRKYSISEMYNSLGITEETIRRELKEGWDNLYKSSQNNFKTFIECLYNKYSILPESPRFYQILRAILPSLYMLISRQSKNEFTTRVLSNITPFDRTTLNDYMRDIFLPKNIVKIQSYSYSKFPTVYEMTKYGFNLNNSVEIFVIKLNR